MDAKDVWSNGSAALLSRGDTSNDKHFRMNVFELQWRPWEHTRLIAALGYSFGGEFSAGLDQRDSDLVADLSDQPHARFGLERSF